MPIFQRDRFDYSRWQGRNHLKPIKYILHIVKNKIEKLRLDNITVWYGKTTLKELLNSGYEIKEDYYTFHEETSTIMCSFFKDDEYMGELVFWDKTEILLADLMNSPIGLVLLENENSKREKETYLDFMDFVGKKGKKDIKLLSGFYLFCWIVIVFCYKEIPVELIYVTALLPVAFFGFSFLFFGLKSFFSYLYNKLSHLAFVFLSGTLFLLWTGFITMLFLQSKLIAEKFDDVPFSLIPIILMLIISAFLSYQIICFWVFDDTCVKWKLKVKKYLPLHLILYSACIVMVILYKNGLTINNDTFAGNFITFLFIQYALYCAYSLVAWIRVILGIQVR